MDLTTTYLGLRLRTPLVVAASPLSEEIDNIKRMEDAGRIRRRALLVVRGATPAVIASRFITILSSGTYSSPEALTYFPEPEEYQLGPEEYLKHIARAKEAVHVPIIASLNGSMDGGWTDYAKAHPASRRGRAGTEHLLHPDRTST